MTEPQQRNKELGTDTVVWKLSDLYRSSDCSEFIDDADWCKTESRKIGEKFRGAVARLNASQLHSLVLRLETLDSRIGRLATYAFLNFTTQIDNEAAGALYQEIHELSNSCGKETIFFELEWNKLEEKKVVSLLAEAQLANYRHYLEALRRYRPHQLEEIEERLLIETKTVGRKSWTTLFEKVIGNLRFGPDVEWVDELNYQVDPQRGESFYEAIRGYWPGLPDDSLLPAYSGIRPKINGEGVAVADFVIQDSREHGVAGLINLFGIESPGLTSSLALADYVLKMSDQDGG